MLLPLIGLAAAALAGQVVPNLDPLGAQRRQVVFQPRERAVSNWRLEAALHLDETPGTRLGLLLGRDPAAVTRCVRLNNYWCIKRAGWAGEIAADREGHVAFASAAEGAAVAALLLKRYYVDYGRHSAYAIVSHWAPASCATAAASPGRARRATSALRAATPADHLALHGIRGTLRARFLASRGRHLAGPGRGRLRVSAVPDRLLDRAMPAPSIAVGLGEKPVDLGSQSLASLPLNALTAPAPGASAPGGASPAGRPILACADETPRIRAYAARAAAGLAASQDADLKLFDASGRPTANLARMMRNMSAVEIGPLGAGAGLVASAVRQADALVGSKAPAASSATANR